MTDFDANFRYRPTGRHEDHRHAERMLRLQAEIDAATHEANERWRRSIPPLPDGLDPEIAAEVAQRVSDALQLQPMNPTSIALGLSVAAGELARLGADQFVACMEFDPDPGLRELRIWFVERGR